jgi:hypothetical protein
VILECRYPAHKTVVAAAVDAAVSSDDPVRAAAARHRDTVDLLRGQRDALGSLARVTRSAMRKRYGLPDPDRSMPNAGAMRRG